MSINLWLSADEERILERIMRQDGARTKQQALIKVIRDTGARLEIQQKSREVPVRVAAGIPS